jgi:hypothetical protein
MYYVGGGRWWWKVESIKSASKAFGKVNCLFVPVFLFPQTCQPRHVTASKRFCAGKE